MIFTLKIDKSSRQCREAIVSVVFSLCLDIINGLIGNVTEDWLPMSAVSFFAKGVACAWVDSYESVSNRV